MKKQQSKSVRLFGAPEPEKFTNTFVGKALSESAAIHFENKKDKNINKLLALEKLALDIFQDSQAARAFVVNPEEYMRRSGFTNVSLDLNSQEIKVAMAIGDPLAREAARKGDIKGFIDAILAQGVKPAVGLGFFASTEVLVHSSALVYTIAAVVTWHSIVTATAIPIAIAVPISAVVPVYTIGVPVFGKQFNRNVLMQIAQYIGDEKFTEELASKNVEAIIDQYTDLIQEKSNAPST